MKFVITIKWLLLVVFLIFGESWSFETCHLFFSDGTSLEKACYNGQCVNGICTCNPGYSGRSCDICTGRILLEEDSGTIIDGNERYAKDNKCSWVIQPKRTGSYIIRLRLEKFATECGWDYLYVYDGVSAFSPLLASFNGVLFHGKNDSFRTEVVASSGKAFLHFFSDAEYILDGFRITYSVNGCPQNCSGNGRCNFENATCSCDDGWAGEACEVQFCDQSCLAGSHCYKPEDDSLIDCSCAGKDPCIFNSNSSVGNWKRVNYLDDTTVHGRASHVGVVIDDSMWFYGGIQFNDSPFSDDFVIYNVTSHSWSHVVSNSSAPSLRYGHSVVLHQDIFYVFGGRDVWTSSASEQLWTFDPSTLLWKQISYEIDSKIQLTTNTSVLALWGHTANVVKLEDGQDVMIVMFGFHTEHEFSAFVFEYDFESAKWNKVVVNGERMEAAFGHTSTWDPVNRLCYVHGGFSFNREKKKFTNTDAMFSYQPDTKFFKRLRPSGRSRFLHSSVLMHGILMVYGGCAHVDNGGIASASCFSPSFMAYDPMKDTWKVLKNNSFVHSGRYGHVALTYEHRNSGGSEMMIFGGYDGETLNEPLVFRPYSCDAYSTTIDLCTQNPLGLSCQWNGSACTQGGRNDTKRNGCEEIGQCSSCKTSSLQCRWCGGECKKSADCAEGEECPDMVKVYCEAFRTCQQCEYNSECQWYENSCDARKNNESASCLEPCDMHKTCDSCLPEKEQDRCIWCSNKQLCLSTESYLVQFPYGECMEWINKRNRCPGKAFCDHHMTCSACMYDPYCGWCDDGKNNGLGNCHVGSVMGTTNSNLTQNVLSYGIAPSENNLSSPPSSWYFFTCPICQCNGHSTCYNGTSQCIECQNRTTGDQCERCIERYFGPAINGGECKPCQCFGRADNCHHETGSCYCTTKGMTGDDCERCDVSSNYIGDPSKNGTCYYKLRMNYSFTFSLSKRHDENITAINFVNTPEQLVFTELNFKARDPCDVIVNVVTRKLILVDDGKGSMIENYQEEETNIVSFTAITAIDFYGLLIPEVNESFRIYVTNFTVTDDITISLVQRNNELLTLLLIIFSCFLILLLVSSGLWKLKLFYDAYRLRRLRTVERKQMATRPFGSIFLLFDNEVTNEIAGFVKIANDDVLLASAEMIKSGKCLISTVVLQMPACTKNDSTRQQGTLALGSCLFRNRKPFEIAKPTEPKRQQKKLKVLFKKGSRLRHSGRSANAHQSTQNNRSNMHGDSAMPTIRDSNRTESSLSPTTPFPKAAQVNSVSENSNEHGETSVNQSSSASTNI